MVTDFAVYLVFIVQDLWYYFLVCIISFSLLTWQMATKETYVLWPTILVYSTYSNRISQTNLPRPWGDRAFATFARPLPASNIK